MSFFNARHKSEFAVLCHWSTYCEFSSHEGIRLIPISNMRIRQRMLDQKPIPGEQKSPCKMHGVAKATVESKIHPMFLKKLRNRAGGPVMPELPLPACSQVNPSVFNDSRIFDSLSPWGGPSRDLAADKTARVECGRKNLTKYLFIIGGLRLRVLRTDWRICWYLFYHDIRSRL